MVMMYGRWVSKVVTIVTSDLSLIEKYADNLYPNSLWVDLDMLEHYPEIKQWLQDYIKELYMLEEGEVDYILIEYDM